MTSKRSQLDDTKMSRGSKIHELRVSMGEPGSVDISVDMTFPHLRRRIIMNLNVFHKTNKMKLSTDEYTQQCWVKGQMG